jgi:xylose isomerase
LDWIARQGAIEGLNLVDFNCPQHLKVYTTEKVKRALDLASLRTGAVCTRFTHEFENGAFTHPESSKRKADIDLVLNAGELARAIDAKELVVWSAYDGYDYSFHEIFYPQHDTCSITFSTRY